MSDSQDELSYYRAIEDFFAALRGVPHVLSPRDFQLMRGWWREGVPLVAVTTGITEVFSGRRERGDEDPVVSLSYCRHAVKRAAKRFAEMHVGDSGLPAGETAEAADGEIVQRLIDRLQAVASRFEGTMPRVTSVVAGVAEQLARTPEMSAGQLEEHLYSLESAMLAGCWRNLPEEERSIIDRAADDAVADLDADEETKERTRRAVRDRELRGLLGLPRLELE